MGRRSRALDFVIPNLPTPPSFGGTPLFRTRTQPKSSKYQLGMVKTFAEFLAALAEEKAQITLTDDITITERIEIHQDVTINFNGHSMVSNIPEDRARVFEVSHGELTLTGKGKIFALGEDNVVIRATGALSSGVPDYTVVTIDKEIEIYAPDGHAILVTSSTGVAYGVRVDFAGKIFARNGIWLSARVQGRGKTQPVIRIRDEAEIVADGQNGVALQAEGLAEWRLGAVNISGAYGMCFYEGAAELRSPKIAATGSALWLGGETLSLEVLGGVYAGEDYGLAGVLNDPTRVKLIGGEFWGQKNAVSPDLQILDFSEGAEFYCGTKDFHEEQISTWGDMPSELIQPKPDSTHERQELIAAIMDLKKLQREDFAAGYFELMDFIEYAEMVLVSEETSTNKIHEVAEELLARMDALEMTDNSTMSDDELDNLFYSKKIPPELLEPDDPKPRHGKGSIKFRVGLKRQRRRMVA